MFAWRLARASLPTGQEKERRHMTDEALCPICKAAVDSWRHALLDCNMAKSVWSLHDDDSLLPVYGDESSDPKLWLFNLCNTLSKDKFVSVLVTLWAIWWARRKAIHGQEFHSPLSTHQFIEKYLHELEELPARPSVIRSTRHPAPRNSTAWIPPEAGEVKLNVDGAVAKSSNTGAVGVVCRNEVGHFIGASAVVFKGITEPSILEAYACREALALAEDLVVNKVRIASDCLRVINDLKNPGHLGEYCMIVQEINDKKRNFQSCELIHEHRANNGEAHRLARMATTLDSGRHVWPIDPPDHLCIPLNFDT